MQLLVQVKLKESDVKLEHVWIMMTLPKLRSAEILNINSGII